MSRKRFIVVGLGNFGSSVASTLHDLGREVVALDVNPERVDKLGRSVSRAAVGDGTNATDLKRLGAENAEAAIISTGEDLAASALTSLILREMGVEEVYVKVTSDDHARLIEKIGVTETIFPERESGIRLGRRIANRLLLNYVQLGTGFGLQEMAVPNTWVGRSLRELALPRKSGVVVVAVHDMLMDEIR
ncbi:MAG: TrkA family potassium uptake protein, partial [Longimicrobiales bacterium]|nr:TrkA family potassium uptake protein [Longimicrobiales bacterium]